MDFNKTKDISSLKWGPHYWLFLHACAYNYPNNPNSITKRKYYDLIQNMPLFIPDEEMGNRFAALLDNYPVSPYLDCRESFIIWMHFIHNKINVILGKPTVSLYSSLDDYHKEMAKNIISDEIETYLDAKTKQQLLFAFFIFICLWFIFIWI
jgi:hypothetical protein